MGQQTFRTHVSIPAAMENNPTQCVCKLHLQRGVFTAFSGTAYQSTRRDQCLQAGAGSAVPRSSFIRHQRSLIEPSGAGPGRAGPLHGLEQPELGAEPRVGHSEEAAGGAESRAPSAMTASRIGDEVRTCR